MPSVIQQIEEKYKKRQVVDVRSGDVVKVHQKIREGNKERVQIFQGLVIRTDKKNSPSSRITVRRVASGVGVEKSFLLHSPLILKVEVTKRSKVRRNYLTYMRKLTGKSARLTGIGFDVAAVNEIHDEHAEAEEEKLHEQVAKEAEAKAAKEAETQAKADAKVEAALKARDTTKDAAEEE
ncbi:MAG TPA: 50S ribosomal protein L19 [Candidatus Saccharimonadales bacterium]|nr:50S ribosomal protein L19 [Candidatus Saccharimonadales bacterium]